MYRHSPIRNPRSKGIKTKNVLQVCLLVAVCFWLIFQVKRSHDKKKEFDNTKKDLDKTDISLNTNKQSIDEAFKLGRKDLHPKFEKDVEISEEHEEQDEEHEEQDEEHEEKIDGEKEDGGGGGDDEIDEHEQEKSDVEVDREETEVVDEESQTENENENENGGSVSVDEHEENGGSIHTHEGREENYKADDASSAVVTTHLATENGTLEEISVNNQTSSLILQSHENGPPSNTVITTSNQTEGVSNSSYVSEVLKTNEANSTSDGLNPEIENGESEGEGENLEGREEILDPDEVENETHLEEKEVRMDLDTLPEIETEGGNSEEEDTAVERR